MRVGNSPLLSSRLRRGSSHLEKASLPRQTPRIGSYSNRDASSALAVAAAAAPHSPLLLLAAPSTRCPRSFILYPPPSIQVRRLRLPPLRAPPEPSPVELSRHRPRHPAATPEGLCVCARAGAGSSARRPPRPALSARTTHAAPSSAPRAGSWRGIRKERVRGRWACQSRLQAAAGRAERLRAERPGAAGCQPGKGTGKPGGMPAPSAARGRVPGQKGGQGRWCPGDGGSGWPEAPGGACCQRPGRLQACYRCGFGRNSRFPPLCVQLPVMLCPASSFLYL